MLRKIQRFEYVEPTSLDEVFAVLAEHGEGARILAGGTDLLVIMKEFGVRPAHVVNIKRVPGLNEIAYTEGTGLRLGTLATITRIERHPLVRARYTPAVDAASTFGSRQVRNLASVGGNLCFAAPSAEMATPMIVLGATATVGSARGRRTLPLEEFFTGPKRTVLQPDEMLLELQLPDPAPRSGGCYLKFRPRKAMDIAVVGVAAAVTLEPGDGAIKDVKIGLGAVAPTPIRARQAEDLLRGNRLTDEVLAEAGRLAAEDARPITDIRASAEYRRELVKVLTRRALRTAAERAAI